MPRLAQAHGLLRYTFHLACFEPRFAPDDARIFVVIPACEKHYATRQSC